MGGGEIDEISLFFKSTKRNSSEARCFLVFDNENEYFFDFSPFFVLKVVKYCEMLQFLLLRGSLCLHGDKFCHILPSRRQNLPIFAIARKKI